MAADGSLQRALPTWPSAAVAAAPVARAGGTAPQPPAAQQTPWTRMITSSSTAHPSVPAPLRRSRTSSRRRRPGGDIVLLTTSWASSSAGPVHTVSRELRAWHATALQSTCIALQLTCTRARLILEHRCCGLAVWLRCGGVAWQPCGTRWHRRRRRPAPAWQQPGRRPAPGQPSQPSLSPSSSRRSSISSRAAAPGGSPQTLARPAGGGRPQTAPPRRPPAQLRWCGQHPPAVLQLAALPAWAAGQ